MTDTMDHTTTTTKECPSSSDKEPAWLVRERAIAALKEVFDPEIPMNIYDLGLIYKVDTTQDLVKVEMTLTTPMCPVAGQMPVWVKEAIEKTTGVPTEVELVWDPPWDWNKLPDHVKLELGIL